MAIPALQVTAFLLGQIGRRWFSAWLFGHLDDVLPRGA